jgi:hypothetical protein
LVQSSPSRLRVRCLTHPHKTALGICRGASAHIRLRTNELDINYLESSSCMVVLHCVPPRRREGNVADIKGD